MTGTVLITGATRGIGRAVAAGFAADGWRVVALNRTLTGEDGIEEIHCALDDPASIALALERLRASAIRIDALVLNAATRHLAPVRAMEPDAWADAIAVNLSSAVLLLRELLADLGARGGHVVLMGSEASVRPFEEGVAYCVTKAALRTLAEILQLEETARGVRVTLVTAGAVRNRPKDDRDPKKMDPASIAWLVRTVVGAPPDVVLAEIDVRPRNIDAGPLYGIQRLQYR